MGADPEYGPRGACSRGCHLPNTRAQEVRRVAREVTAQWGEALDLLGGICPTCRHRLNDARPDGGDGIYTWCGVMGCTCGHHDDPLSRP